MLTRRFIRSAFVTLLVGWYFAKHVVANWAGVNGLRVPILSAIFDPIPAGLEPMPHQGPYDFSPLLILPALLLLAALVIDYLDLRQTTWLVPLLIAVFSPGILALGSIVALFSGNVADVLTHVVGPLVSYSLETGLAVVLLWVAYRWAPSSRSSNPGMQRTRYARR